MTASTVETCLAEAADTLRRLPGQRPMGFKSCMPVPVRTIAEAFGWHDCRVPLGPPSPGAISRLDEVLSWMRWLDDDETRLVWARAIGVPWAALCRRLRCSRTTAWRKWVFAINKIAARINDEKKLETGETFLDSNATRIARAAPKLERGFIYERG